MTVFTFVPSPTGPFEFQPTLDDQTYQALVTWNISGRRYYLSLYAVDGTRVLTVAVVGSTNALQLQSLEWRNGRVFAVTTLPHGYSVGRVVELTVTGAAPDAYDGRVTASVIDQFTLSWTLEANPGIAANPGSVSYDIDLTAGYFTTSRLVYRQNAGQFEVSP